MVALSLQPPNRAPAASGRANGEPSFIVAVVVAAVVLTAVYWLTPFGKSTVFRNYLQLLYYFGVVVVFLSFAITQYRQAEADRFARIDRLAEREDTVFARITQFMVDGYPYLFRLYQQMNPHNQKLQQSQPPTVDDTSKQAMMETIAGRRIFESIDASLLLLGPQLTDNTEWLRIWREWFCSAVLRDIWRHDEWMFRDPTRQFINERLIGHSDCRDFQP